MGLLKKPLDYTKRCDSCKNWIPSYVDYNFEGTAEGDGNYCKHADCYSFDRRSNEKGYSRLIQRVINAIMLEFTDGDDMFLDEIYRIQVLTTMANCCPIYDKMSLNDIKTRNKKYGSLEPLPPILGDIDE